MREERQRHAASDRAGAYLRPTATLAMEEDGL